MVTFYQSTEQADLRAFCDKKNEKLWMSKILLRMAIYSQRFPYALETTFNDIIDV